MNKPYIGQAFISNQYVVFVYVGDGQYINTVSKTSNENKDDYLDLQPLKYRQYEA